MQRAAVWISSNIAEGRGRKSTKVYVNHLSIAHGSLMEIETQLQIAYRLKYIDLTRFDRLREQAAQIGKMLNALQNSKFKNLRIPNPAS